MVRGSRKHILDWVEQSSFPYQLTALLMPLPVVIQPTDYWMPHSHRNPTEARLETFGRRCFPVIDWHAVHTWWLTSTSGANTPNWDLACTCTIQGQPGLVLIEAKAHTNELSTTGKSLSVTASAASIANHQRIGAAIQEAAVGLAHIHPAIHIARDTHYQLANRLAWSWKLASLGLPVILVYLGFLQDNGMSDIGDPIKDMAHWQHVMAAYMQSCFPPHLLERPLDCGHTSMYVMLRTRSILQNSAMDTEPPNNPM